MTPRYTACALSAARLTTAAVAEVESATASPQYSTNAAGIAESPDSDIHTVSSTDGMASTTMLALPAYTRPRELDHIVLGWNA